MSDSSDTEFSDIPLNASHTRGRHRLADKVEDFTDDIQDARSALKDIDQLIGEYGGRSRGSGQQRSASAIDRLRADLLKSNKELKKSMHGQSDTADSEESERVPRRYRPTSPLYEYKRNPGDEHYRGYPTGRRPRSASAAGVTFDRVGEPGEIHELHQTVRNLTEEQYRINAELYRERKDRQKSEREQLLAVSDLTSNLQRNQQTKAEKRLEKRLKSIANEISTQKQRGPAPHPVAFSTPYGAGAGAVQGVQPQHIHSTSGHPGLSSLGLIPPYGGAGEGESFLLKSRLTETESELKKVSDKLSGMKDKCQDLQNAKATLSQQLRACELALRKGEEERAELKGSLERARDVGERAREEREKTLGEREKERERLGEQVESLRAQLSRSISGTVAEEYREELQRNERQREQLSDHIQALSRSVQQREDQVGRLQTEVQELTQARARLETQQEQAYAQLEEAARKIRDITRQAERYSKEAADNEQLHREAEKRRDEVKVKAQETVKAWKVKYKAQEKEMEGMVQRSAAGEHRLKELTQEAEVLRHQLANSARQMDQLSQELGGALSLRAEQDQKMDKLEEEVQMYKASSASLEKENQEKQTLLDRRGLTIQNLEDKMDALSSTLVDQEALQATLSGKLKMTEDSLQAMKEELMTTKHDFNRMTEKFADESQHRLTLGRDLCVCQQERDSLKKEVEVLEQKLMRLDMSKQKAVEDIRLQLDSCLRHLAESEYRETKQLEEFTKKFKATQTEKDGKIAHLKSRVSELESSLTAAHKRAQVQAQEVVYLEQTQQVQQETVERLEKKCARARRKWEDGTEGLKAEIERCELIENELTDSKHLLAQLESQNRGVLSNILRELEEACSYLSPTHQLTSSQRPLSRTDEDVELAHEIYSKLHLVKSMVRENRSSKEGVRQEMALLIQSERSEKERMVDEMRRQQESLDQLAGRQRELERSEAAKEAELERMMGRVRELSRHLDEQKERELLMSCEKAELRSRLEVMEEIENSKDTETEKQKIEDRYRKLQMTMNSLKELTCTGSDVIPEISPADDDDDDDDDASDEDCDNNPSYNGRQTALRQQDSGGRTSPARRVTIVEPHLTSSLRQRGRSPSIGRDGNIRPKFSTSELTPLTYRSRGRSYSGGRVYDPAVSPVTSPVRLPRIDTGYRV